MVHMRIRWQPRTLILAFSGLWLFLSGATSLWGATDSVLQLNESQILYLFSTSAQVLAGVYGLTLTGFIFFRNELSREEFEDETLAEAVESLKRRYFTMLVFITAFVLFTFFLSNLAMAKESGGHSLATTLLINSGQSAFGVSILAISYFIFDVISPKRIEVASRALQEQVDPAHKAPTKGSLEDFLRNYNQIEMLLSEYGSANNITSFYTSRPVRRASNVRLAEILMRNERISQSLFSRLRDLITLRNSIIHGADPVVSSAVVATSQEVLNELEAALRVES